MKTKIYLRIAQGSKGVKVEASTKSSFIPIIQKGFRADTYFPTVAFAIELDIPDELFKTAEKTIASVVVGLKQAGIAAEVFVPGKK